MEYSASNRAGKRQLDPASGTVSAENAKKTRPVVSPVYIDTESDCSLDSDDERFLDEAINGIRNKDSAHITNDPTQDPDGFKLVVRKRTAQRRKSRPHPAIRAGKLTAESRKDHQGSVVTLLIRPTDENDSLHTRGRLALATCFRTMAPEPVAVRNIRRGGLAVDFPAGSNLGVVLGLSSFAGVAVSVGYPKQIAGCFGTIVGDYEQPDELLELYSYHQGNPELLACRRIGETKRWVLHFAQSSLPARVAVFYNTHMVRPYFRPPIQCFKCRRFDHVADMCRGAAHCNNCGATSHRQASCPAANPRCVNCGKSHPAHFKQCGHRIFALRVEKEIANTQCSRREARILIAATRETRPSVS